MCSCMCGVELLLPHLSSVKALDWTLERVDVVLVHVLCRAFIAATELGKSFGLDFREGRRQPHDRGSPLLPPLPVCKTGYRA